MSATDNSLFDVNELVQRCMGNEELAQQLIQLYTSTVKDEFGKLRDLLDASDLPGAQSQAHRMKGPANNISAKQIGQAAAQVEQELKAGNTPELIHLEGLITQIS